MSAWTKHPNNASHQPPMRRIIEAYGLSGYGLYWCIKERVADLRGLLSLNTLLHEFCTRKISRNRVRDIIELSEMFEISDEGLVSLKGKTEGESDSKTPRSARANLLNTLDKEERYKKDSSIETLISASTSESEKEFYQRMKAEYPRVCQMSEPLTFAEMQRLLNVYPRERIHMALNDMENYPNLLTKYLSANRTLRKWIK